MATTTVGSGLQINFIYGNNPSTLPDGFVTALDYAAQQLESIITSPITVTIDVQYGTVGGFPLPTGALGASETSLEEFGYSDVKNALAFVNPAAAASMPATMPVNGMMWIGTAEATALGLTNPIATNFPVGAGPPLIDGFIGLSNSVSYSYDPSNRAVPGEYDFIGVVEHEITEAMGRIDNFGAAVGGTSAYTLLDMFHYTNPGAPTYTGTQPNYFSVDGGQTNLAAFNDGQVGPISPEAGDLGDWDSSVQNDSFDAFINSGTVYDVTQSDADVMNALGFAVAPGGVRSFDLASTSAEAVQGGPRIFTQTTAPHIADGGSPTLVSATIQITDASGQPIAGDELTVNGAQNGSVGSGIAVSWDASTSTLTLSGSASISTYENLLGLVTYQDSGSDASTGGHPERILTWTVDDGTNTTAATQQITIDRAPIETPVAATASLAAGSTASVAALFQAATDPDGDTIQSYVLGDSNPSVGQWELNGQPVSGTITAAELSQVTYQALGAGTDNASLQANDGITLSSAQNDSVAITVTGGSSGGGPGGGAEAAIFSTIATLNAVSGKFAGTFRDAGLTLDSAGNIYGTTPSGGGGTNPAGTVFEIANSGGTYAGTPTVLADFSNVHAPNPGLVVDSAGDIFGATTGSGVNYNGAIFEIPKNAGGGTAAPVTLFTFGGNSTSEGFDLNGGLVADSAGNLFGLTRFDGTNNDGTVFELAKTSDGYASSATTIANFDYPNFGIFNGGFEIPQGSLIIDSAGNLFGTASSSGSRAGFGTVFEIANTGGSYAATPATLYSFTANDPAGENPQPFLVMDAKGDLFGTTAQSVFEIPKVDGVYASVPTVLATFETTSLYGQQPNPYLVLDAAGDIFGSTSSGGANGLGTVFEIAKTDSGYGTPTVTYSFQGAIGVLSPIADAAGDLFGTGGVPSTNGIIFELSNTGFVTSSSGGGGGPGGSGGGSTVETSDTNYVVPAGVTNVILTGSTPQTVTANNAGDTITSNDAGSTIIGGSGNDTLIAGHNVDTLTGGGGDDTFVFGFVPWSAGHITDFAAGMDKIDLSGVLSSFGYTGSNPIADGWLNLNSDGSGDTLVYLNSHDPSNPFPFLITTVDHVDPTSLGPADFGFGSSSGGGGGGTGGGGSTVETSDASYVVPAGVTNVILTGSTPQTVTANNAGDTITSNDAGSTIIGGSGNDTLIAGHNVDTLTGGGGDDTFVFNFVPWSAGHITDFAAGMDKIDLSGVLTSFGYTGTNPIADGWLNLNSDGAGDTLVYLNSHDPSNPFPFLITTIDHVDPTSLSAADFGAGSSSGGGGTGGGGSTVETSDTNYVVPAGVTNVILTGSTPQTVTANNAGDTITSNDAGSTIIGGSGNDTLIAGHNADTLTGGGGSDTFVFNFAPWSAGHITDFTPGTDKLDLSGVLHADGYTGTDPVADGWVNLQSDGAGDTNVYLNAHDPSFPFPYLITTVDHVDPSMIHPGDYLLT